MGHSQAPQFKATDAVILVVYQSRSRATVDPLLTWCSHRSLGPIHGITQYQDSTRSGLLSPDPEEGLNPETRVTQSGWIPSLCLSMWLTPHTRPVSMGNEWSPLKACRKKKKNTSRTLKRTQNPSIEPPILRLMAHLGSRRTPPIAAPKWEAQAPTKRFLVGAGSVPLPVIQSAAGHHVVMYTANSVSL